MDRVHQALDALTQGLLLFLRSPWSDPTVIIAVISIGVGVRIAQLQQRQQDQQTKAQREANEQSAALFSLELRSTYVHIFRTIIHVRESTLIARDLLMSASTTDEDAATIQFNLAQVVEFLKVSANDLRSFGFNPKIDHAAARLIGDAAHYFDRFLWMLSFMRESADDPDFPNFVAGLMKNAAEVLGTMVTEVAARLPSDLQRDTQLEIEARIRSVKDYEASIEQRFKEMDVQAARFIAAHAPPRQPVAGVALGKA